MYSSEERLVNKPVFLRDHELGRKGSNIRTKICEKTFELQGMDFTLSLFTYGGDAIEMIVQNDEVSFFLHIKNDYLNYSDDNKSNEEILSLRFNYAKILELFKKIFANSELHCFGKHPLFEYEFIFLESSAKNTSNTKSVDTGNRKRRRVDTKKLTHRDSKLGLRIKIIPQPDFLLEPASFHFEFITVPKFDIDPLPNEILLEIFRFLDSKFLILDVSFVNKKFHQLIDSEFLYRHHHLKCLMRGFEVNVSEKKTSSVTWKEHTKRMFQSRLYFVVPSRYKRKSKVDNDENVHVRTFRGSDYVIPSVCSSSGIGEPIPTSFYVSPKESHTWVLKTRSETPEYFTNGCAVGFLRERDPNDSEDTSKQKILGVGKSYGFEFSNYSWWFMDVNRAIGVRLETKYSEELLLEVSLDGGKMKVEVIEIDGEKPTGKNSSEICEMEKTDLETKFSLAVDFHKDADWEIISFKKN